MRSTAEASALVRAFDTSPEEEKSRELILALLELTMRRSGAISFIPATSLAPRSCFIPMAAKFC